MALLITQFEKACSNVEPIDGDVANAAAAHRDVRETLADAAELSDLELDTVLIGSYRRHVSIRHVKDVDVFSRTAGLDLSGSGALDLFEGVLVDAYGDQRVHRQDRSIQIDFADYDLYVDAVPARRGGGFWEVPDRDGSWVATNPELLTTLSSAMNERYEGLYVPIVKLIRQTRRTNIGKRPGGFYLEILTYHAFNTGVQGANVAELFVCALSAVADQLADVVAGKDVTDPTMPGAVITIRVEESDLETAAARFRDLAVSAAGALADEDHCRAAKRFRAMLGKTTDGDWVFEMPATCNDDGTNRAVGLIAGDREVPAGDRRFA